MPDVRYYNVHDLIRFNIVRSRDRGLLRPINLEFAFFETSDHSGEPDIVLNISRFVPQKGDCHLIDHKYHVRPNYFYCSDAAGQAKWETEITGFESGNTVVNFWGRSRGKEALLYPDLLPQDLVLKPLIEYKLCKRDNLLIHAAAVCKDNRAYLLAGRGGAYKTTLAMQLVQRSDFHLMADDQAILQGDTVLSFPKHIAQLSFKLEHMQTEDYGLFDKLRIIGYLCRGQFDVQIPYSAPLQAIIFVSRTNTDDINISKVSVSIALEKLVLNNMMDMNSLGMMSGLFLRYMQAYAFVFPNSDIAQHWNLLRQGLAEILSKVPLFEMQVPATFTMNTLDAFENLVQDTVG